MTGSVPAGPGPRLDRAAVERVIQRAAELQANERDISEGLTEQELKSLANDVGIPESHFRQALLEERTRSAVPAERGLIPWLAGPRRVGASRTMAGEAHRIEAALQHWMAENELLTIKRRFPQQTTWEAKQGAVASIRRALSFGGHSYVLTRAREVAGQVIPVDSGRCHVQLVADLSNTITARMSTATGFVGAGVAASVVGTLLGVATLVVFAPVIVTGLIGYAVLRTRREEVARVHVALEQILDRLEHGEIEVQQQQLRGPRPSAFVRIADELLKQLRPGDKPK
ncbi:MAG: hypothetical protein EXR93_09240 [Gemmatimonadetes bacterium]|nr:hypothetical protein [Gemmatimonadota bacterium]